MKKKLVVTDDAVEEAYKIMARIVRDYGGKYLPVFKRLHDEYEERKEKRDLTSIAFKIAAENDP